MQPAAAEPTVECRDAIGKENQRERRWQRERGPRRERADIAAAYQADGDTDLTRCGAWKKLAKRHQIGVAAFAQPLPSLDELAPEIAEMRDRTAERGQPQFQEGRKNFGRIASGRPISHCFPPASSASPAGLISGCRKKNQSPCAR
jgi:hypothetical protein